MTALVASSMGYAQNSAAVKLGKVAAPKPVCAKAEFGKAQLRSVANGNYFTRPVGSFWLSFNKEGMGYNPTVLVVPPYVDATYTNKNANPSQTSWYINGQDASEYVDANGNFTMQYGTRGSYYTPTLAKGADEYTFPNLLAEGSGSFVLTDSVSSGLSQESPWVGQRTYGYSGFMSTQYLFGTGKATIENEDGSTVTYTSDGFVQSYDAPMSPLYLEDIWLNAVTWSTNASWENPIADGKSLKLEVISQNDGHVIATLTATKDDLAQEANGQTDGGELGTVNFYTLTFSQKEGRAVIPFVINEAFTIKVTGFSQDGVELGLMGFAPGEDDPLTPSAMVLTEAGAPTDLIYQSVSRIPVGFTGMFESVFVPTELTLNDNSTLENANVLRVADDGSGVTVDGSELAGSVVYTASDWYDEAKSTEYYGYRLVKSSTGDGSWIQGMTCDDSNFKELAQYTDGTEYWQYSGQNIINFTTDPINAGEGRWAVVEIVSYRDGSDEGFAPATNRVVLLQGNAKLSDVDVPITTGIKNVNVDNNVKFDANAPVYNLNGQRVSKNTKGILIQNGKKFINK